MLALFCLKNLEHQEQTNLITWSKYQLGKYPELRLLFAIPNGGQRHIATATRLKAEGVKAGVPDLFLPVARHGYHGLFIEMKAGKNKPTDTQIDWMDSLEDEGYLAQVCYGFENAKLLIETYLSEAEIDKGIIVWDKKDEES